MSSCLSLSIVLTEWITVVWSLFENDLPISGKDFDVSNFAKYIAVCLGLTKYLDLLADSISFLLILKNWQTIVWIESIVTLFSERFIKSLRIALVSASVGNLLYILENEIILFNAPTNSLMLVWISKLINFWISSERFNEIDWFNFNSSILDLTILYLNS